jgi:CBS domain-containing protein
MALRYSTTLGGVPMSAQRWAIVTAKDLMRKNLVTVPRSASLSECQRILSEHRIGGAPVVDEKGAIVGIVSLKDLVEAFAQDPDLHRPGSRGSSRLTSEGLEDEELDLPYEEDREDREETVGEIMSDEVQSVPATAGLKEIASLMARRRIHRVLVEENGRYVGILTTIEILEALAA